MQFLPNILFALFFFSSIIFFFKNCKKIYRNINLARPIDRFDNKKERFFKMLMLAFGQSKMLDKPVVGLLHLVVYVAFVLINPRSVPHCGSVKHIVPLHFPSTIFGRYVFFISSLA